MKWSMTNGYRAFTISSRINLENTAERLGTKALPSYPESLSTFITCTHRHKNIAGLCWAHRLLQWRKSNDRGSFRDTRMPQSWGKKPSFLTECVWKDEEALVAWSKHYSCLIFLVEYHHVLTKVFGLISWADVEPATSDLHLLLKRHMKGFKESPNVSPPHSVHMVKPLLHWGKTSLVYWWCGCRKMATKDFSSSNMGGLSNNLQRAWIRPVMSAG